MKYVGIDHIVLRVRDREESLRFYGDVLGMEKLRVDEWRAGDTGFPSVRVTEGTIIDLMAQANALPDTGRSEERNMDHFCLAVPPEEWDVLVGELRRTGVAPDEEPRRPWGARGRGVSVYILDPDGNQIEVKSYSF